MTDDRAARRYRRILRLAPAKLRARHGAEMEQAFLDNWKAARERGGIAGSHVWVRATWDVLRARLPRRPLAASVPGLPQERRTSMVATEFRSAFRSFRRQKLGTALVVAMLSLGIAANVVVFTLVNGLFLRPFPFPEPDQLVYLNERAPKWNLDQTGINYPDFDLWRKSNQTFAGMALYGGASFNLSDEHGAERITGGLATHDFLSVLRLQPLRGRFFTPDEDRPGIPRVVVISEGTWRTRFGADEAILGKTMQLNGRTLEIVGVLPRQAEFPGAVAVLIPLSGDPNQQGNSYSYSGIGRLKPGVAPEVGSQDLHRVQETIWNTRDKDRVVSPLVMPLRENFVSQFKTIASALWAAVTLLLIVACANVAAVMLARAIARRKEMGIRLAIGANRLRLLRQLLIENAVLAVVSGVLGVVLGRWAISLLVSATEGNLPSWAMFDLDGRTLLYVALAAAGTSLLFGWAPALHAMRGDLRSAMHDTTAGSTTSPRGRRTLTWLVAAEFTLASVLLVGGVLLFRAFGQVQRVDPGFRPDHTLAFSVSLPAVSYADGAARLAFWDGLLARLRSTPGIETAGIITCPPLTCHWGNFYRIEGRAPLGKDETNPVVLTRVASDGYFEALGVRVVAGRSFDGQDGRALFKAEADRRAQQEEAQRAADARAKAGAGGAVRGESAAPPQLPPVIADRSVIVNESFVRMAWPGTTPQQAVGRRLAFNDQTAPWINIVGVTADVKHYGLERPMRPGIYFPVPQMANRTNTMAVIVRTKGDPEGMTNTVRQIVGEIDRTLPLYQVRTMESAIADSLRTRATYSWMLAVFAGLAFVLALGGTYGVTSYLVTQRTREIGIRMAMGAGSADILRAVLRGSLSPIGLGVAIGLASAVWLAGLLTGVEPTAPTTNPSLLFGVSPGDPAVIAGAAMLLALAALVANWIPARRAARTDPATSIRQA
jgi:predicted permease